MTKKLLTHASRIVIATLFIVAASWSHAAYFTVPYNATLYLAPIGGNGGALSEFGIGTSIANRTRYFTGLPWAAQPNAEVLVGTFAAGSEIDFYLYSEFVGLTAWAFSNLHDGPSTEAFDAPVQKVDARNWILNLDDAISGDHDNDDLHVQIRLSPVGLVPEPHTYALMLLGCAVIAIRARRTHKMHS